MSTRSQASTASQVQVNFTAALTPGGAITEPLNYALPEHFRIYVEATKGLDPKYNGKEEHLRTFLCAVQRRAKEYGWENVTTIQNKDLFLEHGVISYQDLQAAASLYDSGAITRSAQNSQIMFEFLMNSIDSNLMAKVINMSTKYRFQGRDNGPALLKTIISLVQVATAGNATPFYLQNTLITLPTKIKDYDSIIEFNLFVRSTLQSLENYGKTFDNLLPILFQSYLQVEDQEFQDYIKHLMMQYDYGYPGCVESGEDLLQAAEEQYKLQLLRQTWKVPDKMQAQILALKLQLNRKSENWKNKNKNKLDGEKQTTYEIGTESEFSWKNIPPKTGQSTKIKRDNRIWLWCKYHGKWCTSHGTKQCTLKSQTKNKEKKEEPGTKDKKGSLKAKLADLLMESDSD